MKVRGFQVAPAELEAHLLNHPYVRDACVVGIHDEFNGEIPLAFIAPTQSAMEMIREGLSEAQRVKMDIQKVIQYLQVTNRVNPATISISSTYLMPRCSISGWRVGLNLSMKYQRIPLEKS
jgi:acyl-coenzyme A synthetase/AMP-(fatty) acid ligase